MLNIRLATCEDLVGMARTHIESFPGLYATNMGEDFLCAFYKSYVDSGIAFVAIQDTQVVGHVVGGAKGIRSDFMRRSMRQFTITFLWRLVTNRSVFSATVKQVLGRLARRNLQRASTQDAPAANNAWLQVICVQSQVRGSSVANDLYGRFRTAATEFGYEGIGLSVARDNRRALAFYTKKHFRKVGEEAGHLLLEVAI